MIIKREKVGKVQFKNVPSGAIFEDKDGTVCMLAGYVGTRYGVNMITGKITTFEPTELVDLYPNATLYLGEIG